ncbi:MAG: tetratricopeptide repeat protein [Myxococcota bacterium]
MSELKKIIGRGREAFQSGNYDKAKLLFLKALEKRNDMADIHNMLGIINHQDGNLEEAKYHFERALIINPGYTDASLNLSVTYNELGKYNEARKVYSRAMDKSKDQKSNLDPYVRGKLSNKHAELGDIYKEMALYEEAVREFEKALDLAPSFLDIRTRLADTLRESGAVEAANKEIDKVLSQNKEYVPALISKGVYYFTREEYEKAKNIFEKVLKNDPSNRSCNLYLKMISQNQE